MRLPELQQWSLDRIREIDVTPWKAHEPSAPAIVQSDAPAGEAPVRDDLPKARRVYITQKDLDKFGYTVTCPRCQHIRTHGPKSATGPHSEECRAHIVSKLRESEEGRQRLSAAEQRADRSLTEWV